MFELKDTVMGLELGSTCIKAVLLNKEYVQIASGRYEWENELVDGVWTYSMEKVCIGIQECYAEVKRAVKEQWGQEITTLGAIGISGMMHGYLPFDGSGKQLAEFRTWRNTMTSRAAAKLTELFSFNIPQRWSIAHLYQAILNGEAHVKDVAFITTLAGYIHFLLTGEKLVGIGEASGMFPIDSNTLDFNREMIERFDEISGQNWKLRDILPKVVCAGENAGFLTEEGARFLDPTGTLCAGIPLAPCEGDAGTGMVSTNSVRPRTGNVSAGTSDFIMLVTEQQLGVYKEVDMVTTPAGAPVAMVQCNNCTSDINAWVKIFEEFASKAGLPMNKSDIYGLLFKAAEDGDADCGGLLSYNYISGEAITDIDEGRPVFVRKLNCKFSLANFMRTHLMSALATLKIGIDILKSEENIAIDRIYGHGGFFKTPQVGQKLLSAAIAGPVSVMETAGEGGPYGMALLCAYMLWRDEGETLEDYLDTKVFNNSDVSTIMASEEDIAGFNAFAELYKEAFQIERLAVEKL